MKHLLHLLLEHDWHGTWLVVSHHAAAKAPAWGTHSAASFNSLPPA